jgi:hypothetical protein
MPLSSMSGNRSAPSGPRYWRPDLDAEDSHTAVTTVHASSRGSRTSSQEDLNPTQQMNQGTFFQGVNVQKTFYVSESGE